MSSKEKTIKSIDEEVATVPAPPLRFPEFRAAGDWKALPLGDLATIITERVGDRNHTPLSITAGVGLVSQVEKFGRVIAGSQYRNYVCLQQGDFAYNKSATNGSPQGFIARYLGSEPAAVPNSIFTCFRADIDFIDGEYLNQLFKNNLHGRWLRRFMTVGARAHGSLNIDDEDILAIPVPMPRHDPEKLEQQKISDCLSSMDELLAAERHKLDALKAHKKGLMQQLFPAEGETTPRLRFPEFHGAPEWQERKLEELAERGSGHTPNKAKPEYYNGGIKWVSLADSKRLDRGLISETEIEISEDGVENSSAVLHPAGSVLVSRDAGVGKSAIMGSPMAVSQHFIVWTCDSGQISNWFLYYILQRMKPLFERVATGSTIKTIGHQFFKDLQVTIPLIAEQLRIANCLCSLDNLIESQIQNLESLNAHKKGLMQQLFPSLDEVQA